MSAPMQYATFLLDGLSFGVEVLRVQEVIRYQRMTRVPRTSAAVAGLINLRGQIVTALDLRARLGLPPRAPGRLPMNVVVRTSDGAVSLLVDEIGDVVSVEPDQFEPAPETAPAAVLEIVPGVFKLSDRLLLQLDVDRAVHIP